MASSSSTSTATPPSPITRLLETLGMTREDLHRHSAQMREFLTTESNNSLRALANASNNESASAPFTMQGSLPIIPPTVRSASTSALPASDASTMQHLSRNRSLPHVEQASTSSKSKNHYRGPSFDMNEPYDQDASSRASSSASSSKPTTGATPLRAKPSLDMVMQMRSSRVSRARSISEESESSDESSPLTSAPRPREPITSSLYRSLSSSSFASSVEATPPPLSSSTPGPSSSAYYRTESPTKLEVGGTNSYYRINSEAPQSSPPTETGEGPYERPVTPPPALQAPALQEHLTVESPITPTNPPEPMNYYPRDVSTMPPSSPPPTSPPISSPVIEASIPEPVPLSSPVQTFDEAAQAAPAASTLGKPPYTLPSGPYSSEKPELSYAAMIGRAILASPDHMLRLKDIYDYISIVWPHFKRDGFSHSQKWMNAVRQNLTNTPHFIKLAPRPGEDEDRDVKGSYWHIRDEDLACFANGHYNRNASAAPRPEKRKARKSDEPKPPKASKRQRKGTAAKIEAAPEPAYHYPYPSMVPPGYLVPAPSGIIFPPLPPSHPNSHLINAPINPAEVMFPPLPAFAASHHALPSSQATDVSSSTSYTSQDEDDEGLLAANTSSFLSMPDLTPDKGSSSPPIPAEDEFLHLDCDNEGAKPDAAPRERHQAPRENSLGLDTGLPVTGKGKGKEDLPPMFNQILREPTTPTFPRRKLAGRAESPTPFIVPSDKGMLRPPTPPLCTSTPPLQTRLPLPPTLSPTTRTPGRSRQDLTAPGGSSMRTPKRLSSVAMSPFRTPSRRMVFDPHDPSYLLDDALSRMSSLESPRGFAGSPGGLLGRARGLLYESPSLNSPGIGGWRQPW